MKSLLLFCVLREPLKIHFGVQANLFDSGLRQAKAALASTKAHLPSLPEYKNLLLAAQKQLLKLPLIFLVWGVCFGGEVDEEYFALIMDGKKIGYGIHSRTVADGLVTTTETVKMIISRGGIAISMMTGETSIETVDGKPVGFETVQEMGGSIVRTKGKIDKQGKMLTTIYGGDATQDRSLDFPKDAVMAEGLRLMEIEKGLNEGTKYSANVFSASLGNALTAEITIGPKVSVDLFGRVVELTEVKTSMNMGMGDMVTTTYVDDDFAALKTIIPMMGMNMEMVSCDREFAMSKGDVVDFLNKAFLDSPVKIDLGKLDEANAAVFTLSAAGREELAIPEGDYQKVKRLAADKVEVTVTKLKAAGRVKYPYRGTDEEALKSLEATFYIESDNEKIVAMSRKAVKGAKDAAQAVKQIEKFVAAYISEKDLSVGYATAVEVAGSKQGDCTEHTVLTAGLCRAAGIPARVACGIVYADGFAGRENIFGGHAWVECYIGDKWVGVDATRGAGNFDLTHIMLATGNGNPEDFFSIVTMLGYFKIDAIELK